ncbi:hypothetical protein VM1G_11278 [Cytospora mali]|uniref:Aminoglycoside phosphotransferase domain-containing protein n=1 Tax=Cytospora mali TaxID=578113 RepID=A0A194VL93_CYTMA|nr:hypothetical protein VM1G_11278 [Valsa mali]
MTDIYLSHYRASEDVNFIQQCPYEMATNLTSTCSAVEAFFKRCNLPLEIRDRCWALVRELFPGRIIEEVKSQGYCSYTLCVGKNTIVQFRPPVHRLEIRLAKAVQDVYGSLAPWTELLGILPDPRYNTSKDAQDRTDCQAPIDEAIAIDDGEGCEPGTSLYVYSLTRMPGIPLAEHLASSRHCPISQNRLRQQRETLVGHFAKLIAAGWNSARPASDPIVSSLCGKVGASMKWRLEEMRAHLPRRFQPAVRETLDRLDAIESLPWTLTHGDVVPANMMVRPPRDRSGVLMVTGFIDWAEAEYLPFCVGLYGLEELLGETGVDGRFAYYVEAEDLREHFWSHLAAEIPGIDIQPGTLFRGTLEAAHSLGILLWHGIAFDNGRLDRVVEEGKDDEELWRLDIFFSRTKKVVDVDVALC